MRSAREEPYLVSGPFVDKSCSEFHAVSEAKGNGVLIIHANGNIDAPAGRSLHQGLKYPVCDSPAPVFGTKIGVTSFQVAGQIQIGLLPQVFKPTFHTLFKLCRVNLFGSGKGVGRLQRFPL